MTALIYCSVCEQTVHPTDPHSCFSAAAQRAHKDAERAVIEAARALYRASVVDRISDNDVQEKLSVLFATLRALEGDA